VKQPPLSRLTRIKRGVERGPAFLAEWSMHLVQILLPVYDAFGKRFSQAEYERVTRELTGRFGGLTAYVRSPAEGLWRQEQTTVLDEIVVYEVMVDDLDCEWWAGYRKELGLRYAQQDLVIRTHPIERL
jgi:hypothetical protein